MKNRELTNTIWARLKKRIIKANPDRLHVMEWDCTGNDHSSDCWCITETYALALKLGYNKV